MVLTGESLRAARNVIWFVTSTLVTVAMLTAAGRAQMLRIAAYNVDADTPGGGGPNAGPGLSTVLQAMGNEHLAGHAQPLDAIALEELYMNPTVTLQFIADTLNSIYPSAHYAYDPTTDLTSGDSFTGNGENGLVYNTKTVQVLDAQYVGDVSLIPRAPMRYTLAPVGYNNHVADFTMYVSHMKASTGQFNADMRNDEAIEIRDDAATLGPNAHIIYAGDYNIQTSSETTYQTMLAPTSPTLGIEAGAAHDTLADALNPPDVWDKTSQFAKLFTESADNLDARFDFQLVTAPMLNHPGVQLVPGTLGPFGSNGSASNVVSPSNTALADLGMAPYTPAYRMSVLNALLTTTDHLPILADYSFASAVSEPSTALLLALGGCLTAMAVGKLRA
jgi:hypothetical protein